MRVWHTNYNIHLHVVRFALPTHFHVIFTNLFPTYILPIPYISEMSIFSILWVIWVLLQSEKSSIAWKCAAAFKPHAGCLMLNEYYDIIYNSFSSDIIILYLWAKVSLYSYVGLVVLIHSSHDLCNRVYKNSFPTHCFSLICYFSLGYFGRYMLYAF